MTSGTKLIKREKQTTAINTMAVVKDRPTRKDVMALELVLVTFGASNVLKAISEISRNSEVIRFFDELPKIKQNVDRLEVCGHYRDFLESLISAFPPSSITAPMPSSRGVVATLQTLLKACGNRVHLNMKHEKTKGFVGTWLATKRVIHKTIEAVEANTNECVECGSRISFDETVCERCTGINWSKTK